MSSSNYAEEFPLLKKLLKNPAFRFVIIRYNHFDLVRQVQNDLQDIYSDRPSLILDAQHIDFSTLFQSYCDLNNGILYIHNFETVLKDLLTSRGEETEEMRVENERRRAITSGLNLRRDKLAKIPNVLVLFISSSNEELYLRKMMEKMPDLWSFRSLYLDLVLNYEKKSIDGMLLENPKVIYQSSNPILEKLDKNKKEIQRLEQALRNAKKEDIALKLTIYPQLTRLLKESGIYDKAIIYFDEWLEIMEEEDKAEIYFNKGDVLINKGDIDKALIIFQNTLKLSKQFEDKYNEGVCYERIGNIYKETDNLDLALQYYDEYFKINKQLVTQNPNTIIYNISLSVAYSKIGDIHQTKNNLDKALEYFKFYYNLSEELIKEFPDNIMIEFNLAVAYSRMGDIYGIKGNLDKALECLENSYNLSKELSIKSPDNTKFKNGLAVSHFKLGNIYLAKGEIPQTLTHYKKCKNLLSELSAYFPAHTEFKKNLEEVQQAINDLESS